MSRSSINFFVDCSLALLLISLLAVSGVVHFIFPAPTVAAGWTLWGLGLDAWSRIQLFALAAFALNVLLHLILHWSWVCGFLAARWSRRTGHRAQVHDSAMTLYGVATLIAALTLLGTFLLAAELAVIAPQ